MNIDELTLGQIKEIRALDLGRAEPEGNYAVRADGSTLTGVYAGRCVVVIDRGWIFAGNVTDLSNGRIRIEDVIWVYRWEKIGFNGVLANPEKAELRPITNSVDLPKGTEIFRIPVHETWGK